jgi:shikimate dehydrogenase
VKPKHFAVVGDPVGHSKSPLMHQAAFRALGLPHTYEAVRATAAEFPSVVAAVREGRWDGLNVTIPHKERALLLADAVDATAAAAGVANTLVRAADGRVVAHNTDIPGLAEELRALTGGAPLGGARALILGSGGTARAAWSALSGPLGLRDIAVRARSPRALGAEAAVRLQPWVPSPPSEATTLIVVQATSAGMTGADPGEPVAAVVAWEALPDDAVALDVIYAPAETPFLRAARARGLRCDNGFGMLARQGALALELWLGEKAPLSAMRAALELPR